MKAVILAGGKGSRISEESRFKPKPLVEIGGRPILWHIMKLYSFYGVNEFIVCCGYKGHLIKEYFVNYNNTCKISSYDLAGSCRMQGEAEETFKVTLVDTGLEQSAVYKIVLHIYDNQNFSHYKLLSNCSIN